MEITEGMTIRLATWLTILWLPALICERVHNLATIPIPHKTTRTFLTIHSLAKEFDIGLRTYADAISDQGFISANSGFAGTRFLWPRDYLEVYGTRTVTIGGQVKEIPVMLSYWNPFSNNGHANDSSYYVPMNLNLPDGYKTYKFGSLTYPMESRRFHGFLEGGNVFWGKDILITSEKTIQQNLRSYDQLVQWVEKIDRRMADGSVLPVNQWLDHFWTELKRDGYEFPFRDRGAVIAELSKVTSITTDKITIMEWLPGEVTGHVDVYLGKLTERVAAIPYVPDYLISELGMVHERNFAESTNRWLEEKAKVLSEKGLAVIRLPMLAPKNLVPNQFGAWDATFLSTVNWAVKDRTVLIPHYQAYWQMLSPATRERFLEELVRPLEDLKFTVKLIPTDQLTKHNGGFHCLSHDVELPPKPN